MARIILNYPNQATADIMTEMLSDNFPGIKATSKQYRGVDYKELSFETGPQGSELLIFNHEQGLANCQNPVYLLKLNRIPYLKVNNGWIRRYRVHLVNHQVVSLARQTLVDPATGKRVIPSRGEDAFVPIEAEEREASKAVNMAIRCLYALGLDIGMVKIGVDGLFRLFVTEINPGPSLTNKTLKRYVQALVNDLLSQISFNKKSVIMGTDPEFMLANIKSGTLVPASYFFPRLGEVGCDNIRLPNRKHRPVAELRPAPASNPASLVNNLRQTMQRANQLAPYRNLKWVAGVMPLGFPIGGHIHFSGLPLSNQLLRALDQYLALPLFFLEPEKAARDRRKRYGLLGEYRTKNHGGFEYRTPPSWLIDPLTALGTLTLGHLIAQNYLLLNPTMFLTAEAQERFYNGNHEYFRPYFEDIWKGIESLPGFNEHKAVLEAFAARIRQGEAWDESTDIRKSWNLSIPQSVYIEDFMGRPAINSPNCR